MKFDHFLKNRIFHSSHPGFVFTLPLMLGIGLIIFAALIAISQGFVAVGGPLVPQLLTDMPTFYDYDKKTGNIITDNATGIPKSNQRVDLYWVLVEISVFVLVLVGVMAILSYLFEGIKIVKRGTAMGIITKIIFYLPLFLIFPFIWDIYAILIQNFSLFLLDPFNSGINPATRTAELWNSMGSVVPPDILNLDAWGKALADPGSFGQGLLKDVFLSLFKGFAVIFMTAMMFIISTIRQLLTIILAMSIPLILTLGLVPLFRKVKDMMVHNLVGLSIAPIFSALVLTTGMAYLDSTTLPAMQDWFASLSVGFLAIFFPVMLAPILGQITTQVGQMVSTAITAGSVVGAVAGQGVLSGISNASSQMSGATMNVANSGLSSAGSSMNKPVSSFELGKLTFGASAVDIPQMSFVDKFKTLAKAGAIGGLAGLTAGGLQATTGAMHIPQVSKLIVKHILNSGDMKALEIGQTGFVNHSLNYLDNHMQSLEPTITHVFDKAVVPQTGQTAQIVMNPGPAINEMEYVDSGHAIIADHSLQQQYLEMQCNNIKGFDRLGPSVQMQANVRLIEQLRNHPGSAGKMFETIKNNRYKLDNSTYSF